VILILKNNAGMLIGALVAVILQALVAPYITIGYAMLNLIMCYVILMAIIRADKQGYIMPFVLGLCYDLMSSGTVGAMAFICVVLTFVISRIYSMLANDTMLIPVVLITLGCFVGELIYGCLLIVCGLDVSLPEALLYRMLPCGLYDTVVSLVAYVLIVRFVFSARSTDTMQVIR